MKLLYTFFFVMISLSSLSAQNLEEESFEFWKLLTTIDYTIKGYGNSPSDTVINIVLSDTIKRIVGKFIVLEGYVTSNDFGSFFSFAPCYIGLHGNYNIFCGPESRIELKDKNVQNYIYINKPCVIEGIFVANEGHNNKYLYAIKEYKLIFRE